MDKKEVGKFEKIPARVYFDTRSGTHNCFGGVILFEEAGILIADGSRIYGSEQSISQRTLTKEELNNLFANSPITYGSITRIEKLDFSFDKMTSFDNPQIVSAFLFFEKSSVSVATISSCPRCNGKLIKKEAEEPFTGKKYMIDKCQSCGWC